MVFRNIVLEVHHVLLDLPHGHGQSLQRALDRPKGLELLQLLEDEVKFGLGGHC